MITRSFKSKQSASKCVKMSAQGEETQTFRSQPIEVIEQVFAHLTVKDLKEFMEVCRLFESVIVNSPVLMNKFVVRWGEWTTSNKKVMLKSKRKYRHVVFWRYGCSRDRSKYVPAMTQFVQSHATTMRSISILRFVSFNLHETLSAVTDSLEDLKVTGISESDIKDFPRVIMKKLRHLKLNCIDKELLPSLLSLSENLERFSFEGADDEDPALQKETGRALMTFLQSQERLTEIYIASSHLKAAFDEPVDASSMKLKTETINLNTGCAMPVHLRHLSSFLTSQKSSLTELDLTSLCLYDSDLDALLRLELIMLTLRWCKYNSPEDFKVVNKTIQNLTFWVNNGPSRIARYEAEVNRAIKKILQSCQSLDTLSLSGANISEQISQTIASMPELKNLKLHDCLVYPMKYPNVKFLKAASNHSGISELVACNPQLESFEEGTRSNPL